MGAVEDLIVGALNGHVRGVQ
eukprot:SAG11_NODE_20096_length_452_cov_5.997167_2_plen_20_part_01